MREKNLNLKLFQDLQKIHAPSAPTSPFCQRPFCPYAHSLRDLKDHHYTDLDIYGAKSLAEFFAVITEEFFEKPLLLRKHHPQLYKQLKSFYNQNTVERSGS